MYNKNKYYSIYLVINSNNLIKLITIDNSQCLYFFRLLAQRPNLEKKFYIFKQILS